MSTDSALALGLVATSEGAPKQQDMAAGEICDVGRWQSQVSDVPVDDGRSLDVARPVRRPSRRRTAEIRLVSGDKVRATSDERRTYLREFDLRSTGNTAPSAALGSCAIHHHQESFGETTRHSSDDGRTVDASNSTNAVRLNAGRRWCGATRRRTTANYQIAQLSACRWLRSRELFVSGACISKCR